MGGGGGAGRPGGGGLSRAFGVWRPSLKVLFFESQWLPKTTCIRFKNDSEQLGGGDLLGDTSTLSWEEAGDQTSNLPVTSQPDLPPELRRPTTSLTEKPKKSVRKETTDSLDRNT